MVTKSTADEMARVDRSNYAYLLNLPSSSIPNITYGTDPENNVTIKTTTGFKSADEMATAFRAADNYGSLPFTVYAVDNKLQILFNEPGTQYLRALQVWGDNPVPFQIKPK